MTALPDQAINMEWEAAGTHREITVMPTTSGGCVLTVEDAHAVAIVELTHEQAVELAQNLAVTP